jgi:predicted nucleic acid-binding protein
MRWRSTSASTARRWRLIVCLDSFALLCWLHDEPGAEVVEGHLVEGLGDEGVRGPISMINRGEVFYRLARRQGAEAASRFWDDALRGGLPIHPVEATRRRVREAAGLKARHAIAFADAFAIQLAIERRLPLLTGDPEMEAVERSEPLEIRWLPRRRSR